MNWYVVEAVFQADVPAAGTGYSPLLERSWFLVSAEDEGAAEARAVVLARSKEHSYANSSGESVYWAFKGIEHVREIMDEILTDGTELWSCIVRVQDSLHSA